MQLVVVSSLVLDSLVPELPPSWVRPVRACCSVVLVDGFHLRAVVLVAILEAIVVHLLSISTAVDTKVEVAVATRPFHRHLVVDLLRRHSHLGHRMSGECPLKVRFSSWLSQQLVRALEQVSQRRGVASGHPNPQLCPTH